MTKKWIKAALVRAIKTMAQTAAALIGTGAIGILDVDWIAVLSASALSGVLSLLTSIAGLPEVKLEETVETLDYYDNLETDEPLEEVTGTEFEDYLEEE